MLNGVLERVPQARGVLFDLPQVIEQARRETNPRIDYIAATFSRTRSAL